MLSHMFDAKMSRMVEMMKSGVLKGVGAEGIVGALSAHPSLLAEYFSYLAAKRELTEMKSELARLQQCVQQLEGILEQQGTAACGHSGTMQTFINWMVSFAESYYSLAAACRAKNIMLPRVLGYLRGERPDEVVKMVESLVESLAGTPLASAIAGAAATVPGFGGLIPLLPAFLKR
jgi:hypothetical protein